LLPLVRLVPGAFWLVEMRDLWSAELGVVQDGKKTCLPSSCVWCGTSGTYKASRHAALSFPYLHCNFSIKTCIFLKSGLISCRYAVASAQVAACAKEARTLNAFGSLLPNNALFRMIVVEVTIHVYSVPQ
jgi:hypothetical protein